MSSKSGLYLSLELVWWGFTGLIAGLLLYPLYSKLEAYPFYWINSLYIVTAITLTRYIFLLPYTFLGRWQIAKIACIFISIPFIFYLIEGIHTFNEFLDYGNLEVIVGKLPKEEQEGMMNYLKNEMYLFGVGSVISAVIFPFRMMFSVWRLRNKGLV